MLIISLQTQSAKFISHILYITLSEQNHILSNTRPIQITIQKYLLQSTITEKKGKLIFYKISISPHVQIMIQLAS